MLAGRRFDRRLIVALVVVALVTVEIFYGIAVAALADGSHLPLIAVIGLITVVVTFVEPVWGLYLFVAAVFAEGMLTFGPGATGARLLGILVLGAWIAHSLSSGHFQITLPLQGQFVVIFIAWGLISAIWAIDPQLVLNRMQILVQSIALYVMVISLVNSPRRLQNVLSVVVVTNLVLAVLVISRVLSGQMTRGRVDLEEVLGFEANNLAAYLLLGATLLMVVFSRAARLSRKLLSLFILSIVVLAILATGSRGAMVALVTILTVGLILDRRLWQLVFPVLLIGGAALLLLPPTFFERAESIVTLSDRGAGRMDIWLVGLEMISDHPVLGVGLGNFGRGFSRYFTVTPGIDSALLPGRGPHNIFIGTLAESGVIGFTLFTITLGLHVKGALATVLGFKRRNDPHITALATGVLLGLVGLLVASVFVDLRYRKYFWLLLALAGVVERLPSGLKRNNPNESARSIS